MQSLDPALQEAVRALIVASRALVGIAARSLADLGDVTLTQFRALVVLSARPGTTVSELAATLDIHPTTATRLTDRLVRKGLTRRSELAGDRRVTQLHLTDDGHDLVRQVTDRRARDLAGVVEQMPPDSWPTVTEALATFAAAAGESDDVDLFGWSAR